jgi:dynein heavy chain
LGWLKVSTEQVSACARRVCVHMQKFKSIKSRGAIQQQMMNKLVDTLEQFLREVIAAQEMFDRCKANPPLTRNQPPVAGGSAGARCVFCHCCRAV